MAFDRQAALDAGYTQAEIDAYLQNQPEAPPPPATAQAGEPGEPPAPTTTVTPAGEGSMLPGLATTGLGLASAAVPLGVGIGVGKYGGRALDAIKTLATGSGAAAPGPVAPPVAANPAVSPSYTAPAAQAQQPGVMQRGMDYARQMQKIAAEKVMQGARAAAPMAESAAGMARAAAPAAVGLGALFHSGALNAGEDEELRRRRAMAPTIR